jgi:transcription factor WhiB
MTGSGRATPATPPSQGIIGLVILPVPEMPELPRASCAGTPEPDAWFSADPDMLSIALRICRRCPERAACLAFAERHGITTGIWGGTTPGERGHPALSV